MNPRFGSIGKFVVAFLTGAAAVAVILQWYNAPKGKLRATIVANEYEAPPSVDSKSIQAFTDTSPSKPPVLRKLEGFNSPELIGAYLHGRVENEGSKEVKQVTLTIPDAAYACVHREPSGWNCQSSVTIVTIGDLAPLESAIVQIWLRFNPQILNYKDIRLTHSEGVGRINYETVDVPPGLLGRNAMPIFLVVAAVLLSLHIYFSDKDFNRRYILMKRREEEEAAKASEDEAAKQRQKAEDEKRTEIRKHF
jgi:hypothetical protein